MLFNSYEFIFGYLPVTLAGFFLLARSSHRLAALWLAAASLFFYGWWNPVFVLLVMASIAVNYAFGYAIGHARLRSTQKAKMVLTVAVVTNLSWLAYFKYANFFIANLSQLMGAELTMVNVVLPLGISFFTFTQIAFLVDVYRGIAREYNFIHYVLFVTYFPHLIAGPVLHHKQMMPQFGHAGTYRINLESINIGLTIFTIGLAKKVLLADQFALYANPVFDVVAQGGEPKLIESWIGALAYTLQLYFDFSGYSDMAIGLSRMFNVKLPLNFDSPYKAQNIIEFWRRWHMTLSTFLRDYLYVPLGGSRKGGPRRYANLMATMLLGGLWHGAGWTFVLWGGLHGMYLVINHGWRRLIGDEGTSSGWRAVTGVGLTFIVVVIAWVPFRATDLDVALRMWAGMFGGNGVSLPLGLEPTLSSWLASSVTFEGMAPLSSLNALEIILALPFGMAVIWLLPNTQQFVAGLQMTDTKIEHSTLSWIKIHKCAVCLGAVTGLVFSIALGFFNKYSPFLYFQF
jgi:alginate O-acetyltransferase complex protein AlgI